MHRNNADVLLHLPLHTDAKLSQNSLYRITVFIEWLDSRKQSWYQVNLNDFKSHLLNERRVTEYDASVYLSTVRSTYRRLLMSIEELRAILHQELQNPALVESTIQQMILYSDSRTAQIKAKRPKGTHRHYTLDEVEDYLDDIDTESLKGCRDWLLLSTLFATGVHEKEVVALEVKDFFYEEEGVKMLHVPSIGEAPERFVEYGPMIWLIDAVQYWLKKAQINEGLVFRRIHRNGKLLSSPLSPSSINNILEEYLIEVDDETEKIHLVDIRFTYSRTMHKAGVGIDMIHRNLGHENLAVTQTYIGELDKPDKNGRVYITSAEPNTDGDEDLDWMDLYK